MEKDSFQKYEGGSEAEKTEQTSDEFEKQNEKEDKVNI